MATPTTQMNTKLASDTQAQIKTETLPPEKIRELARFLNSAIQYHRKDVFYARLAENADINFYGLDDQDEHENLPLIQAIICDNEWAFDELLKRGADPHKVQVDPTTSEKTYILHVAVQYGNLHMVEKLLEHKVNPRIYHQGTFLTPLLECIHSKAVLNSRWQYADEPPGTNNLILKKQMSDFFFQKGQYAALNPSIVIPFVYDKGDPLNGGPLIQAHYEGKQEILGLMLSEGVLPTIPVYGTYRSPLALVENPQEYANVFRANPDEDLDCWSTDEATPNILRFAMRLANIRNTGTLETSPFIVIHYDLEPSRLSIKAAMAHNPHLHATAQALSLQVTESLAEAHKKIDTEFAAIRKDLMTYLQTTLSDNRDKLEEEIKQVKDLVNLDKRQEIARFNAFINTHPNAQEAYKSIQIALGAIHTSALAVKGGGVTVSEGSLALVASALDMSKELVEMIPIIGSAASKFFGLASATATHMDTARQTNLFENIAAMATSKEARKIFESIARKLTMAYFEQFKRLATTEMAEAHMSDAAQCLQKIKEKTVKSRFKSPTEQVTAFAIIWMMDEVFSNAHLLQQEIKEQGLETLLLNAVIQHKPSEKLTTFWNELTKNLGINAIPTCSTLSGAISAETWHPGDFWTKPGIKIEAVQGGAVQYFAGNGTEPKKFGYRLGSIKDIEVLGLTPIAETVALLQATPVPPPSPRMIYAYGSTSPSPSSNNTNEGYSPSASASSVRKSDEIKTRLDVPPSVPKRSKSPFAGFKIPGFRRGCPTPLATS